MKEIATASRIGANDERIILNKKEQLNNIITDSRGRPDRLAIDLYFHEFRSWYSPIKEYKEGKIIYLDKLRGKRNGRSAQDSYKKLAKRHGCSEQTVRRKIVILEKLNLISRSFDTETHYGLTLFNKLHVYVWRDTPYFYNPIGIDRNDVGKLKPQTNHKYIASKYGLNEVSTNKTNTGSVEYIGIYKEVDTKLLRTSLREEEKIALSGYIFSSSSPTTTITPVTACEENPPIQKPRIRVAAISERTETTEQGQSVASLEPRAASSLCPTKQPSEVSTPVSDDNAFVPESNSPVEILRLKTPMESLLAKIAPNGEYDEASSPPLTPESALPIFEPDLDEEAGLQNRLRMQIDRFLDEEAAEEIRKKCIFVKTEPGKMLIKIRGKLALSDYQRVTLRNAIYSVYGNETRITQVVLREVDNAAPQVTQRKKKTTQQERKASKQAPCGAKIIKLTKPSDGQELSAWEKLKKSLVEHYGESDVQTWLESGHNEITEDRVGITLKTLTFIADHILGISFRGLGKIAKAEGITFTIVSESPYYGKQVKQLDDSILGYKEIKEITTQSQEEIWQ